MKVEELKKLPIVVSILERLRAELSPALTYHNVDHTLDVLEEVVLYASEANLDQASVELLVIAAAYHDAGFLFQANENESKGAELAAKAMRLDPKYSENQIELVQQMIVDTTMRVTPNGLVQIPSSELSGYLLDADLSNLGRTDFFEKGKLVLQELRLNSEKEFLKNSLKMLMAHKWHTPTAHRLRQSQKEKNLIALRSLL